MPTLYRWKFLGFSENKEESPYLLRESTEYFKTEEECVMDARGHYKDVKFSYMIVLSVVNEFQASHPEYISLSKRLFSFRDWPPCMPFTGSEMARNGFFYTGEYDKVVCHACGVCLKHWQPGSNVARAHKKQSLNCYFVARLEETFVNAAKKKIDKCDC